MCLDCPLVFHTFFDQKHGFWREIGMGLPAKVIHIKRQSDISKDAKSMLYPQNLRFLVQQLPWCSSKAY